MLAKRRAYREEVFEYGSGTAQFLGAMNAYMLDPVSIATMPIASATTTAKGLQAVGRVALKAGAIEGATEMAIQPFVYSHKHDIGAPYDWKDALLNISTAAIGASALSGSTQGIKEFIRSARVSAEAKGMPEAEYLSRMEDTLSENPLRKEGMDTEQLVKADVEFLETMETKRAAMNEPSIKPEHFDTPPKPKAESGTVSQRERSILDRIGQTEEYDQDMQSFRSRQGPDQKAPMVIEQDGELVDAGKVMDDLDGEIKGLDDVILCTNGGMT